MPRPKKLPTVGIATDALPASVPSMRLEERGDELPVLKSIGYVRVAPNSKLYVSYVITSRGREILDISVSKPDLKAVASEQTKIDFVQNFDDHDDELIQEGKPL